MLDLTTWHLPKWQHRFSAKVEAMWEINMKLILDIFKTAMKIQFSCSIILKFFGNIPVILLWPVFKVHLKNDGHSLFLGFRIICLYPYSYVHMSILYGIYSQHGWVIIKCRVKLLIHSQTSTVEAWEWISNFTPHFNTLRPRQNGHHFADAIFKCIFLNENVWIPLKISLKFVPNVRINNIPVLVQIMAWCRQGDKPLSEPMMVNLPTHICVPRPQWVNGHVIIYPCWD